MAYITGTNAPETLTGTDRNDSLLGFAGDDHLLGLNGADQLFGMGGADLLEGGLGDDVYQIENDLSDTIVDIGGFDTIRATVGVDLEEYPEIEGLAVISSYGGRPLRGNSLDNDLHDGTGGNLLDGRVGDDTLYGELGDDILIGGPGTDVMLGGRGADRFDFRHVDETGLGEGNRDVIGDFSTVYDILHFGLMDADSTRSGNQAFAFIGTAEFSGIAGELRYRSDVPPEGSSSPITIVSGDVDGDGVADFEVQLYGSLTLTAADFIL
jgi:Ca2+-binding RTX toxin-like protein